MIILIWYQFIVPYLYLPAFGILGISQIFWINKII